jgi:hypothetical protein
MGVLIMHPDEASQLTQEILEPFFEDRTLMFQLFRALRASGHLERGDTSWKEHDATDPGDVEGMVENAVQCHVYGILRVTPAE